MAKKCLMEKANRKPKFGVCRLCFRELAVNGMIPGVTKASW